LLKFDIPSTRPSVNDLGLWPLPRLKVNLSSIFIATPAAVEERCLEIYPGTYPVVFSSARAGIHAILRLLGASRNDLVWTLPYSSHCVQSTISLLASPSTTELLASKFALVYHQWGFPLLVPRKGQAIIEDSVDSVCVDSSALFPNNGRFEMFSFPKLLGSTFGGVVLCRTSQDQESLRAIRQSSMKLGAIHHLRREFAHISSEANHYWSNSEALNGPVPRFVCAEMLAALETWPALLKDRESKLQILAPLSLKSARNGRFPCCIPLKNTVSTQAILTKAGITIGDRAMITIQNETTAIERVLPVPIHIRVPVDALQSIADQILKSGPSQL
jgi:putative PLP-dependent aminotransferase (TIGR04422 family)